MTLSNLDYIPVSSQEDLHQLLRRLEWIYTYFNQDTELHDMQHRSLDTILSTAPIHRGERVAELDQRHAALPTTFRVPESRARHLQVPAEQLDVSSFLERAGTRGLLISQEGAIVHEEYLHGHQPTTRWMTNSASKLIVGMLTAIAVDQGAIKSFDDTLGAYAGAFRGTEWDGVTISQCLSMTTGIDWDEEDLDLLRDCPWVRFFYAVAFGSIERFVKDLGRGSAPGTVLRYSSMDTQALGATLIAATGKGIASYLEEAIWKPAGMESDAYWVTDAEGQEMALGGLCATLRDYARLGLILANGGEWQGQEIVPHSFVQSLSMPTPETFWREGYDDYPLLCWNQSFIPSDGGQAQGDYMAAGSYGQLIYVNPARSVVIAHHGIYPDIATEYVEMYRHFHLFRTIAHGLAG